MSLIEAMFKVEEGPSVHLLVIVYSVDYRLNIYSLALSLSLTHIHVYSVLLIIVRDTMFPACYLCP